MVRLSCQNIRTHLIILLLLIAIVSVECRRRSHGKLGRSRAAKLSKSKLHFTNNVNRVPISSLRASANQISMRKIVGGSAALIVGTLAMRSYVSNNNKAGIRSRHLLANGTGSVCVNRENFSNFIFHEFRCPLSPISTSTNHYCCGPVQQQYCCSFWEGGSRAIGAIIGIISACSLFFLFIICCIVYYRRHVNRQSINDQINMEQPPVSKQKMYSIPSDSPPPYSEAVMRLTDV